MKRLIENWNKFINEDEIDEGVGTAALATALAMGGGVKPNTQQNDTDTSSGTQTTQQVDAEVSVNTLVKNSDGSVSYTVDISMLKNMSNEGMAKNAANSQVKTSFDRATDGGSINNIQYLNASGAPSNWNGARYIQATGTM